MHRSLYSDHTSNSTINASLERSLSEASKENQPMNLSDSSTTSHFSLVSWLLLDSGHESIRSVTPAPPSRRFTWDILKPLRQWLDRVDVCTPDLARSLCKLIPAQCPFERELKFCGKTLLYIPPLCKLNPLYEEVVGLRFRAICYLADECGEDVTPYC